MTKLLDEGFLIDDGCEFTFLRDVVVLEGRIICLDSITLEVRKEIAILSGSGMNARVQTRMFRYQAWVRGAHNVLRYDSPHQHRPYAHKHLYNTFGDGREMGIIELRKEKEIPTLGEVIRELQEWHAANASRIRTLR